MQEKPQRFAQGVIAALLGATLWGFSGSCAEFLLSSYEISSIFITMVRMLGASVLFIGYTMITQRGAIRRILSDKRTVGSLLVFGCIGLYLDQITYVIAIGYTNSGTATVLANVGLILIMLVTCFTARRLPYAGEFLGVICAFAAVMLIATKGDFGTLNLPAEGLFWGMMNAASLALYVMQPRKLFAQWGSLPITGLGMLFGGFAAMAVWVVSIVLAVLGIGPQTGDSLRGSYAGARCKWHWHAGGHRGYWNVCRIWFVPTWRFGSWQHARWLTWCDRAGFRDAVFSTLAWYRLYGR